MSVFILIFPNLIIVVSGQEKSKEYSATLAKRKTRYCIAIKIPDRRGETMAKAIIDELSKLPEEALKTITCDRGSEFACWREIEKALHCGMYFADPYCAWQKETNENLNGLLREFYPKGRNLSRVSPATLIIIHRHSGWFLFFGHSPCSLA